MILTCELRIYSDTGSSLCSHYFDLGHISSLFGVGNADQRIFSVKSRKFEIFLLLLEKSDAGMMAWCDDDEQESKAFSLLLSVCCNQ